MVLWFGLSWYDQGWYDGVSIGNNIWRHVILGLYIVLSPIRFTHICTKLRVSEQLLTSCNIGKNLH